MIDKEILMIICMTSGGLLFALGGYRWKWMRRFVLPVVLGGCALLAGIEWWRCLVMASLMIGALCLPYGERTPYWAKFLVGISFISPTFLLGFNVWQIITPICFIGMFVLSNTKWWSGQFQWKLVEFITGGLIGVTVAQLIGQIYGT